MAYIDNLYPVVPAGADFLHDVYGVPRELMELLPLGADTDLAEDVRRHHLGEGVRRELAISKEATVIFTGGKLMPAKRTHILIEAFMQIDDPELHLLVLGGARGGQTQYFRQLVKSAEPDPRIHFVGWVDGADVYRFMDACDFAVFPASQSVLWQQALSVGLPLIVGRVGVQDPSYMNQYDNLIIVDEHDICADTFALKIRDLLSDKTALAQRQIGAFRVARELLNYHRLVERTLTFV
jgi:glycosyltransferase involved in cell wall biosynthesis